METKPLPMVNPPFYIRASLANPQAVAVVVVDFSVADVEHALGTLTVDEASRPATSPASSVVRIVHNRLATPIYIHPRAGSNVVTVYDLLAGIHRVLWSDLNHHNLPLLDALQLQEVLIAREERCRRTRIANDAVRHIDMLDGATLFTGLVQDIARARLRVGTGFDGIDGYQSVTWILQTQEPHLGLGRYPRLQ